MHPVVNGASSLCITHLHPPDTFFFLLDSRVCRGVFLECEKCHFLGELHAHVASYIAQVTHNKRSFSWWIIETIIIVSSLLWGNKYDSPPTIYLKVPRLPLSHPKKRKPLFIKYHFKEEALESNLNEEEGYWFQIGHWTCAQTTPNIHWDIEGTILTFKKKTFIYL